MSRARFFEGEEGRHNLLFLLCWVAYATAYLGRLDYSACLSAIIRDCGFTRAQGGMVGTAFFLVYGVGQLINGFLGDKYPPRTMVGLGLLGSGLVNFCFAFQHSAGAMTALWCLNGFFQSLLWSPIVRIFAEWFQPSYRKQACLRINTTVPVGTVAAYLLSVLFLRTGSWRGQFLAAGVLLFLVGILWLISIPALQNSGYFLTSHAPCGSLPDTNAASASETGAKAPGLFRLLMLAGLPLFFFALMSQGLLKDGVTTWVPSFVEEQYGLDQTLSVFGTMFLPLVNLGGVYLASTLDKRFFRNELRTTSFLFAVNTALILLLLAAAGWGPWPAYLLLAAATTTMMGANTMLASYLPLAFAPYGKTSSAAGVLNFCIYLGCGLSVWGTGLLSGTAGWSATILLWGACSAISVVCCAAGAGKWKKFTA